MRTEYDPNLIEEAVRLAARTDPRVERALHDAIDPIYAQPDFDARDDAFRRTIAAFFFTALHLDRPVTTVLERFPFIHAKAERCIVRRAPRRKSERADLLIREPQAEIDARVFTLIVQVSPESLLDPAGWDHRMRRELLHASDMLDPAFEYRLELPAGPTTRRNLVRDRYQVLWSAYVEGRLDRQSASDVPPGLLQTFCRVFAWADDDHMRRAVDRVLRARGLTHARLLEWADNPDLLFATADDNASGALCSTI
jgi:hypothetical protein